MAQKQSVLGGQGKHVYAARWVHTENTPLLLNCPLLDSLQASCTLLCLLLEVCIASW